MTQAQLERAVCRATGESRDVIRRVGFQLISIPRVFIPRPSPSPLRSRHSQPILRTK